MKLLVAEKNASRVLQKSLLYRSCFIKTRIIIFVCFIFITLIKMVSEAAPSQPKLLDATSTRYPEDSVDTTSGKRSPMDRLTDSKRTKFHDSAGGTNIGDNDNKNKNLEKEATRPNTQHHCSSTRRLSDRLAVTEEAAKPYHDGHDHDVIAEGEIVGSEPTMNSSLWVQCDKCMKWRRLLDGAKIPNVWDCSMHNTDPEHANCSAPEEGYSSSCKGESLDLIADSIDATFRQAEANTRCFQRALSGEVDVGKKVDLVMKMHCSEATTLELVKERGQRRYLKRVYKVAKCINTCYKADKVAFCADNLKLDIGSYKCRFGETHVLQEQVDPDEQEVDTGLNLVLKANPHLDPSDIKPWHKRAFIKQLAEAAASDTESAKITDPMRTTVTMNALIIAIAMATRKKSLEKTSARIICRSQAK